MFEKITIVFLVSIVFMLGTASASPKSTSCNVDLDQDQYINELRTILTENNIFDEKGREEIRKCGEIGQLLADYAVYIVNNFENADNSDRLSHILNYYIIELMFSRNIDKNFTIFDRLNRKFEVYKHNSIAFNLARYKYYGFNQRYRLAKTYRARYTRSLRHLSLINFPNAAMQYYEQLPKINNFYQSREISFWNKYFEETVCDDTTPDNVCFEKIKNGFEHKTKDFDLEIFTLDLFCNVNIVWNKKIENFVICDKIEGEK